MVTITEDIIHEITTRIVEQADPDKVVLFGSCAVGKIGRDSDVDLLIVEDRPFGREHSRYKEIGRLMHALRDVPVPVDLLVFSRDEVEKWRDTTNHIVRIALREGRTLYERA
ncbi:MAG TPA: nucleotidyltransferase domain-containing protein [Candidatus Hydrogenedentes bacterium]|nr:nucleotidyltransferase domain-containing protein [Candidatus Hydrogenedentota bacterium]HPC16231.1 nucleotidyltransferase domain-containing protein [Candidatus Hydrogenedentota bacterium]HRT18557.1 nucleotidyltransferase domain-containing protein [Candidatus Hydrogenedentota bacterium]HRT63576.1 nucleotidyltransferase domain-containing protein [Candidatus Hydrogenedentota bacterium]